MPGRRAAKPSVTKATSFCCVLYTCTILPLLLSLLSLLLGSPACTKPVYMNLHTEQKLVLHLLLVKSRCSVRQHFSTVLVVFTCFSKSCLLGAAEVQVQHFPGVRRCSGPGVPHPPSASLLLAAGQRCQCRQVSGPGNPHLHPALLCQEFCAAGQPI